MSEKRYALRCLAEVFRLDTNPSNLSVKAMGFQYKGGHNFASVLKSLEFVRDQEGLRVRSQLGCIAYLLDDKLDY